MALESASHLQLYHFTYLRLKSFERLIFNLLWILLNYPPDYAFCWQISPTEIRGTLGSVNQLFLCIGILGALVAGLPLAANPTW